MFINVALLVGSALVIIVSMTYAISLAVVQSHDCSNHGTRRDCTARVDYNDRVPARILVQQHGAR